MHPSGSEARDATRGPGGKQGTRAWRDLLLVPNLLSVARLLAVPVFAWAFATHRDLLAFAIFAGASITDGLDGLLARLLDARSALGEALDPLADKLLGAVALGLTVATGDLPVWFLVLVFVKEAGTLGGVAILRSRGHRSVLPVRAGKWATFGLLATLGVVLGRGAGVPFDAALVPVLVVATAAFVLVASAQYLARTIRLLGHGAR